MENKKCKNNQRPTTGKPVFPTTTLSVKRDSIENFFLHKKSKLTLPVRSRLYIFLILLLGNLCVPVLAEGQTLALRPDLRLWGLQTEIVYLGFEPLPDLSTEIVASFGAAYQTQGFYRNADGSLVRPDDFSSNEVAQAATKFTQINPRWYLGVRQNFLDFWWIEAYYRGWYTINILDQASNNNLFKNTDLPDRDSALTNSFLIAARFTELSKGEISTLREGKEFVLTGEIAPELLNTLGKSSFARLTLEAKGFIPLFEQTNIESRLNILSGYLGLYSITDFTWGLNNQVPFAGVPSHIRQIFGGISPRGGLGGTIRGFESGSFDTGFKNAQSIEFRMVLPTLGIPDLLPFLLVYGDGGIAGMPIGGGPDIDLWTGLASIGAGLGIDLFGFGSLIGYTHLALVGSPISGSPWTPFALGFGFHF